MTQKTTASKQPDGTAGAHSEQSVAQIPGGIPVLLGAAVVFILSALIMMPFVPDDAYVSFRYAEHLADGYGLTFYPGEKPVEGYSNFLWVLLCALAHKLGFGLPGLMPLVSILFGLLNVVVLWAIYRRRNVQAGHALLPLLLFATSGPFLVYSVSGMETPLFSLLLLLVVLFVDVVLSTGGRPAQLLLALTGVLLVLCRPEGIVIYPAAVAAILYSLRASNHSRSGNASRLRTLLLFAGAYVVFAAIYFIWKGSYFGEYIPPSFWARGSGMAGWMENIRMYFVNPGNDNPPLGYYYLALIVLSLSGTSGSQRGTERFSLLLAVALALIYFCFVDPLPGMRYDAALIGLLFLPMVHLPGAVKKNIEWKDCNRMRALRWLVIVAAVALNYSWTANLNVAVRRIERGNQIGRVDLAEWLKKLFPSRSLLAMSDVGAFSYYSGFKTLEINPEPVTVPRDAWETSALDMLSGQWPDVILLESLGIFEANFGPFYDSLINSSDFKQRYRVLGAARTDWFEDRCYWIYVPKELPLQPEEKLQEFPGGISDFGEVDR
ncbi:MAG: hypothetical protein GTO51_07300 [Candidatus Latescibacteria bacterium]|nr:hypothetical protein [Candidatus Latescibacterota bacterium]NIM65779.1 hypothetical protein [Candidatus Latescibacterota bacterium]NIO02274.1 hypothetical protein [Candidatus Latescibacterota bacterium]NIO29142.1 hypothetical protein [Candidatus Latescibacterota bacterium]NIO56764.1 hypothetical protein [Candidatus Latescibacterota bacterium]